MATTLFAMIFLVVEGGLYYQSRTAFLAAAQHGARVTAVSGSLGDGTAAATEFVTRASTGMHLVTVTGADDGTIVTFTVTGTYDGPVPGFHPTVTQSAQVPVERVTG